MIYVTGDIHGDISRFKEKPLRGLKRKDTLIVLGDFGFLWNGSKEEQKALKWLTKRRYQLLFLDGCHDNYDMLAQYPAQAYCGGQARHIGGNLYQLVRGGVFEIEGKKLLCIGGGESHDKEDRDEGFNWWRAELPDQAEMTACSEHLEYLGNQVDYVLTHDAPSQLLEFTGWKQQDINAFQLWLNKLSKTLRYKKWYFGRYHKDRNISPRATAVFCGVHTLE